jgi:DNA-binding NarL/FixJ family response regulator
VRRLRLLVADDHQAVREALVSVLELAGFEVVAQAGDGADAVALTRKLVPDVVLMDLSMPVLGGLEATRLLREVLPDVPVVILSGFDSEHLEQQALAAGAAAYLVKGCTLERLLAALDQPRRPSSGAAFSPPVRSATRRRAGSDSCGRSPQR